MLRITINGKLKESSVHRRIPVELWCAKANRAKGTSVQANEINLYLGNIKARAVQAYSDLKNVEDHVTTDMVMNCVLGRSEGGHQGIIELYEKYLNELHEQINVSNSHTLWQKNQRVKRYLQEFLKKKHHCQDLPVARFTYDHVHGFYNYLKSEKRHSHNTAVKNLGLFKKITIRAFRSGWVKADPFYGFSLGTEKKDPVFLTQEEVDSILKLTLRCERLQKIRDFFIVSCYTGLAFADIKALTAGEITKTKEDIYWIKTKRTKTQVKASIPILPIPMAIIQKYCDFTRAEEDQKVFPIGSNQKTNEYLREISDFAGIQKKVTFHAARHTFATTITLENGIPIETVSKMLGHTNINTTQHYARVLDSKIGKDMEALRANHLRIA